MENTCCICGKKVRFSVLFGDTGNKLSDGVVCHDCMKIAGYGKGFFSSLGLSVTTKAEVISQYYSSPKAKKVMAPRKGNVPATYNLNFASMTYEQLQEEMSRFVVKNAGINLQAGEICYFVTSCYSVKFKDVVVGSTRTSTHIGGGRKGMYVGSGVSQQMNNRQIVSEQYPGNFYVTNKRMICNTVKLSFEIPLTKITTMSTYADGLSIMSAGKTYNVKFSNVEQFKKMIQINNEIEKRKNEMGITETTSVKESDIPKLLREYKSLFDEGIISEAEFNQKKEQLLSGQTVSVPNVESIAQPSENSLEEYIRSQFSKKNKVQAVKYVRETTGMGLKESKKFVDRIFGIE